MSVWLDELRREWLHDGTLREWIEVDGVRGVTSNPAIFAAALSASSAYDTEIADLAASGMSTEEIYDAVTLADIRAACDAFGDLYESSSHADGFVSHEVTPAYAYDTASTIREARRLWRAVDRPNVLIKIPATREGIAAVEACLTEGISINVTLMFTLSQYEAVADAYQRALEARFGGASAAPGGSPPTAQALGVPSVASFFVSRVDSVVDRLLDARKAQSADGGATAARCAELRGKAAVANAERSYRRYLERTTSGRFVAMEVQGATPQRLLWASTSTKDPAYSDVKYVSELVAPHTVTTLPLDTLRRYRDHGHAGPPLDGSTEEADRVIAALGDLGIDLEAVGARLLDEGVEAFAKSHAAAQDAVGRRQPA
jgi:transaldolase